MNKKVMKFKVELAKLKDIENKLKEELFQLNEKKRELNQKRYDLIRQGGQKDKVMKVNKELQELAEEIRFIQDQIEITKQMNADTIHELVVDLIKHREERIEEMRTQLNEIEKQLEREKYEYLKKIYENYTVPFNELQSELDEINKLIRVNGDGNRFDNPRILLEKRLSPLYAPTNKWVQSPFIKSEDVQKALSYNLSSNSLKLFMKTGEIENDDHKARMKLEGKNSQSK